jgi:hypothetical protein
MDLWKWFANNLDTIIAIGGILGGGVAGYTVYKLQSMLQPLRDDSSRLRSEHETYVATRAVEERNQNERIAEAREAADRASNRTLPNCEQHRAEFKGDLKQMQLELERQIAAEAAKEANHNVEFREMIRKEVQEKTKEVTQTHLSEDGVENLILQYLENFRREHIDKLHDRISRLGKP